MFLMKLYQHGWNFRQKFYPVLEGLKDIGHNMSIRNLILVVNTVMVSYLICYNSLLQNAIDNITKCDSSFITKCDRSLLENASGFLLQNATVITNCDNFIIKCDSYYKMGRLLQIATVQSYNLLPSAWKQFRLLCCGQHNIFIDFLGELGNINT